MEFPPCALTDEEGRGLLLLLPGVVEEYGVLRRHLVVKEERKHEPPRVAQRLVGDGDAPVEHAREPCLGQFGRLYECGCVCV